jgi:hypothetical protein
VPDSTAIPFGHDREENTRLKITSNKRMKIRIAILCKTDFKIQTEMAFIWLSQGY